MSYRVVALEEHIVTPEVVALWEKLDPRWQDLALIPSTRGENARRLAEIGDERVAAMDAGEIDVQVLSLTAPGLQNLEPADAVAVQGEVNDLLAETVRARPDRFDAFATLATSDPEAAAAELERAVTRLGLAGAMVFGRTRDRHLDDPAFRPVLEVANALRAPLYLHPQTPPLAVREAYYGGFDERVGAALATHGIGWHYDCGVELLRLVLAGVFDRYPDLQIITGHWGEVMMFFLDRIDPNLERPVSEYLRSNVFVTPSGILSAKYLRWAAETIGVDRLMFATDYPFLPQPTGARAFLDEAAPDPAARTAIAAGNWDRLRAGVRS
ncbi:amidohydrolase family protein [Amycolatopsis jejuensis]|uniref:amidohydrolase family protein n=1 Tax=Amycolatopsis jejuensis TaxID=330084 RepID=UPI0005246B82|nr:amidohydrolase family protein [Amycolatopsis jejuensis]